MAYRKVHAVNNKLVAITRLMKKGQLYARPSQRKN